MGQREPPTCTLSGALSLTSPSFPSVPAYCGLGVSVLRVGSQPAQSCAFCPLCSPPCGQVFTETPPSHNASSQGPETLGCAGGALVLGLRVPRTAFCFTGGSVASAGGSCAPARQEDAGVQRMRAHGPLRILTKLRSESERVSSFRGQQGGPEYETERTHVSPGGEGALLRHCGAESTVTSGPGQGGRQKVRASRRNGVKGHKTDH